MERLGWEPFYLGGDDFGVFINDESERINGILKDAGLVK